MADAPRFSRRALVGGAAATVGALGLGAAEGLPFRPRPLHNHGVRPRFAPFMAPTKPLSIRHPLRMRGL